MRIQVFDKLNREREVLLRHQPCGRAEFQCRVELLEAGVEIKRRLVAEYGIFVELAPNLAGLAEPREGVKAGQSVSVYIKAILPDKMKIKLIIVDICCDKSDPMPFRYFKESGKLDVWKYSTETSGKDIKTVFA